MCSTCFPRPILLVDVSLPSTGSSRASSPASAVLSKRYDFLQSIPPHFVSFAWRYLGCTRCFAPRRTSEPRGPGVGDPVSPAGIRRGAKIGLSQVLEESQLSVCNVPIRRRQDCLYQTITVQQRGPWSSKGKGSHDWVFRRSIALLSDSLSTLRNADYSNTTQDSLPVAGQALLARDSHPQGSDDRFQSCKLHLIPLSQALLGAIASTAERRS